MTTEQAINEVMVLVRKYGEVCAYEGMQCEIGPQYAIGEVEDKLRELVPVWLPIESAPELVAVLACNASGYVGRAIKIEGKWEHIGRPTHWMPLPKELT